MKTEKFSIIPHHFNALRNGYLFFSLPVWERLFYFWLGFLLKLSENDTDNELEIKILGILQLRIKGVKDVVLLVCLISVLLYAYFF